MRFASTPAKRSLVYVPALSVESNDSFREKSLETRRRFIFGEHVSLILSPCRLQIWEVRLFVGSLIRLSAPPFPFKQRRRVFAAVCVFLLVCLSV